MVYLVYLVYLLDWPFVFPKYDIWIFGYLVDFTVIFAFSFVFFKFNLLDSANEFLMVHFALWHLFKQVFSSTKSDTNKNHILKVILNSNTYCKYLTFNMKMSNIELQMKIRKVWQSGFHVMLVIKHLWILKKKLVSFLEKMISLHLLHKSASIIDLLLFKNGNCG